MDLPLITRGQLAKKSGKSFETIRFYEAKGLLHATLRDSSNYRRFRPETTQRLAFIDAAKELGFTLAEIGEILELHDTDSGACRSLGEMAKSKLGEIERQIAELEKQKQLLQRLKACSSLTDVECSCDVVENADRLSQGCACTDD